MKEIDGMTLARGGVLQGERQGVWSAGLVGCRVCGVHGCVECRMCDVQDV